MNIDQLAQSALKSINDTPEPVKPTLTFMMTGKWGSTNERVLSGKGSPMGEIVEETKQGVRVIFSAVEVLDYCQRTVWLLILGKAREQRKILFNTNFLEYFYEYANNASKSLNPKPPTFYAGYKQDIMCISKALASASELLAWYVVNDPESTECAMVLGIVGEIGRLSELTRKHVAYEYKSDTQEVLEKSGDAIWYAVMIGNALGMFDDKRHELVAAIIGNLIKFSLRFTGGNPVKVLEINIRSLEGMH